jgi:hypothetical protein
MESFGKGIGSLEFLCGVLMAAQLKLGHSEASTWCGRRRTSLKWS